MQDNETPREHNFIETLNNECAEFGKKLEPYFIDKETHKLTEFGAYACCLLALSILGGLLNGRHHKDG